MSSRKPTNSIMKPVSLHGVAGCDPMRRAHVPRSSAGLWQEKNCIDMACPFSFNVEVLQACVGFYSLPLKARGLNS